MSQFFPGPGPLQDEFESTQEDVAALNDKIVNLFEQDGFMNADANQETNCFGIVNGWLQLPNYPSEMTGHMATMTQIWNYGSAIGNLNENRMQTLVLDDGNVYVRYFSNSTWSNWTSVTGNIAKLQEGIAIIVDGDTASVAVPVGGYAYIKNNTHGLVDGLYRNRSASVFPVSGGTADNTVFESVTNGGLNALNEEKQKKFHVNMISVTCDRVANLTGLFVGTSDVSNYIPETSADNVLILFTRSNYDSAAIPTLAEYDPASRRIHAYTSHNQGDSVLVSFAYWDA